MMTVTRNMERRSYFSSESRSRDGGPIDQRVFRARRRLKGFLALGIFLFIAICAVVVAKLRLKPFSGFVSSSPATPVLLITVDTLRADHVGCYGSRAAETPAIDFLAAQGARFDDALAQIPLTTPSHAVILTGTYGMWNGSRDFTRARFRPDTGLIAQAFQRHGFNTAAFVSAWPVGSSWGFARGFQTFDDRIESHSAENQSFISAERRAGETIDHTLAWFRARAASGKAAKPFFVWVHLYDPHTPYDPPEPFHSVYAGHLYDGEIAYADSQLGRLFDYLRQTWDYDRTLIVLLSDHGESLGEHGEDEHGFFVYRSTLRVPMIFKLPRGTAGANDPRVIESPVSLVDVAPTLLELTHVQDSLARQFQGSSLAALVLGKSAASQRPVYSESYYGLDSFGWCPLRSVTTGRYQYIDAPRPELYDVVQDPSEKHNLYQQHSADASALRDEISNIERRYTATGSPASAAPPLSSESVEKLRSLGYLAYSAPVVPMNDKDRPDPKDEVETFKAALLGHDLAARNDFEGSDRVLLPLRAKEPGLFLIAYRLGENAKAEHRLAEAERQLRACLKISPSFDPALITLAQVTVDEGKPDEARALLEFAISQHPSSYQAYNELGRMARSAWRLDEAQKYLQKAVELNPGDASSEQNLGMTLMDAQQYKEAVKPLEAAVSLGTNDPQVFYGLATAYLNTHQPKKAIEAARKGLAARDDPAAARLSRAFGDLGDGNRQNAMNEFRSLCNDDPADCLQYEKFFQ